MRVVIGIDVGGSTTKIVGVSTDKSKQKLLAPMLVRAGDPLTSAYGAFGTFLEKNGLSLSDVERVLLSGVGSSFLKNGIYGLPCESVPEFRGIGLGGLYLSGLSDCLVVSIGTGTAIVHAKKGGQIEYLGGTGVGGGTLKGLARLLVKAEKVDHIEAIAESGSLSNVDLSIGNLCAEGNLGKMPADLTAANFGNVSDIATNGDIAKGILNLVYETVGMVSIFAAKSRGVREIVLTGNMTKLKFGKEKFDYFNSLEALYGVHFSIPEDAAFATVIGTALCGLTGENTEQ